MWLLDQKVIATLPNTWNELWIILKTQAATMFVISVVLSMGGEIVLSRNMARIKNVEKKNMIKLIIPMLKPGVHLQ